MSGLRFEDLPPKAQATLLGQTEPPAEEPAPEQTAGKVASGFDRLNERLTAPWPGIAAGVIVLLGWSLLMVGLSMLFGAMAVGYLILAGIALLVAAGRALKGSGK